MRTATMSTRAPHYNRDPSLAVDGNTHKDFYAGSCVASAYQKDPWLRIDLGRIHYVTSVTVYTVGSDIYYVFPNHRNSDNRVFTAYPGILTMDQCIDACRQDIACNQVLKANNTWNNQNCWRSKYPGKRPVPNHQYINKTDPAIANLLISVSETEGGITTTCYKRQSKIDRDKKEVITCEKPTRGRYVTLTVKGAEQLLALCEVEVEGAITFESVTSDSVTLKWIACDLGSSGGQLLDTYKLRYRTTDSGAAWKETDVTGKRHTVSDLKHNTEYVFQVFCYWEDSTGNQRDSQLSGEINVKTHCGVPQKVIFGELKTSPSGTLSSPSATVTVLWTALTNQDSGCDSISHYRLKYKLSDARDWEENKAVRLEQSPVTISHTFTLSPYKSYKIQAIAYNNAHNYSSSDVREIKTAESWSSTVSDVSYKIQANKLDVKWEPPATPNGVIRHYAVCHRQLRIKACGGSTAGSWSSEQNTKTSTYTISNLSPYREYSVKIAAVNGAGRGVESVTSESTAAAVPDASPAGVRISRKSSRSFTVVWTNVPCDRLNGRFTGYSMIVKGIQYDTRDDTLTRSSDGSWTVDSLTPYALYNLQIATVNNVGTGPYSDKISIRQDEESPPAVSKMWISVSRYDALVLNWEHPYPPHGIIVNYQVSIWSTGTDEERLNYSTSNNETSITMDGLKSVQNYSIQVRGKTAVGWAEWSNIIYGFTDEGVPEEPQSYLVKSRLETSLIFEWKEPTIKNGVILGYKVTCKNKNGNPHEITTSDLKSEVQGLQPGQRYQCSVSAKTRKGFGASAQLDAWTQPNKPLEPKIPIVQSVLTTDTTIVISLPEEEKDKTISAYQVVVDKIGKDTLFIARKKRESTNTLSYEQLTGCNVSGDVTKRDVYITAELPLDRKETKFVVGDNKTYGDYVNCALQTGATYQLFYGAVTRTAGGDERVSFVKLPGSYEVKAVPPTQGPPTEIIVGVLVPIIVLGIVIAVIAGVLFYRKRKQNDKPKLKSRDPDDIEIDHFDAITEDEGKDSDDESESDDIEETDLYANNTQYQDRAIPIHSLTQHIRQLAKKDNAQFQFEYQSVSKGLTQNRTVGSQPQNKNKNRFVNIMAYDDTRVKLDLFGDDPFSDYINASYIEGYSTPAKFIASQGPTKFMIGDFWRMLWQKNIKRVVMLTNVMEKGVRKCEKYWPEKEKEVTFAEISVSLYEENVLSDFTIRTLRMTKDGESKTVWQFHYTVWPDHGVPQQAASLLNFMRKVKSYDNISTGPVVVHCSAGVGRTGTFISLDILLEQARAEGHVYFRLCLENLRKQRVNMIQTLDQYIFVHNAVNEAVQSGDTAYAAQDFASKYAAMLQKDATTKMSELKRQFQNLCSMKKALKSSAVQDARNTENVKKNRSPNILPDRSYRPFLSTMIGPGNDYINAVYVDGYKEKNAYIVTQMPLPNTVVDFWRLLYEHKSNTVVVLDAVDATDESYLPYWPVDESNPLHFQSLTIELSSTNHTQDFSFLTLKMTYKDKFNEESRKVRIFQLHTWSPGAPVPSSTASVLSLLDHVLQWQQTINDSRVTVQCLDGAGRSGLFVVCSYVLEKLKLEQEIDIFNAVRQIQISRPQLLASLEQYKFCHDLVLDYLDSMDTYANFQ